MRSTDFGASASRRQWLGLLGGSAATLMLLAAGASAVGQNPPRSGRGAPPREEPKDDDDAKAQPTAKPALAANDKDIKKNVEKLFQLASELKTEVDKTDSAQVLSLALVRKAEEIEKLAKEIRSRAKG
jgi:hypothetical protein